MKKPDNYHSRPIVLLDIDDVLFNTDLFIKSNRKEYSLYGDILSFLETLSKIADIGILSQGGYELQTKKLKITGIHNSFVNEYFHIVNKKDETLKEILNRYENTKTDIFFIDDRLNGLFYAKQALPALRCILIRRGRYVDKQQKVKGFEPDYIINDLNDIMPYITESKKTQNNGAKLLDN